MTTFNSVDALKAAIASRIPVAIEMTTDKIADVITECLQRYYGEYDPRVYQRTDQLMNSVRQNIWGNRGETYVDSSDWHHMLDEWSEEDILHDAMSVGSHGGAHAGTPVWDTSMAKLGDIYSLLKESLIKAGIPVK